MQAANAILIKTLKEREQELQQIRQKKASSDNSGKGKEDQLAKLQVCAFI